MTERKCDGPFCLTERTSAQPRLFEAPIFCFVLRGCTSEIRAAGVAERHTEIEKRGEKNKKRLHRTSQYVSYVFLRITTLNNSFCSEGWRRFSGQEIIIGKQTRRRSGAVNDWL